MLKVIMIAAQLSLFYPGYLCDEIFPVTLGNTKN